MDLKYGQRVCDFRGFFLALEEKLGLKEARDLLFLQDECVDIPIKTIITDWLGLDEDESTYLWAVDLFSLLAFGCINYKRSITDTKKKTCKLRRTLRHISWSRIFGIRRQDLV